MSNLEEKAKEFTESFGFIILFLLLCLGINIFTGQKVLFYFLVLVLIGMLIPNWSKIQSLLGRFSNG